MTNNVHLQFLQQKINDIRSALFFSESADLLPIPVSIVTTLKVDDEGQIWFYINRPSQCLDAFKKEFPAHLDFFRKGKSYSLTVNGKAFITEDEAGSAPGADKNRKLLLVKVKMMTAEYFEMEPQKKGHLLRSLWTSLHNWLFAIDSSYRPYAFHDKEIAVA